MQPTTAAFVMTIVAMVMIATIFKTWIRAKHGYPLDARGGRLVRPGRMDQKDGLADERQIELLSAENGELKGRIVRLEDRIAVLERIATDPAERTARDIESLR